MRPGSYHIHFTPGETRPASTEDDDDVNSPQAANPVSMRRRGHQRRTGQESNRFRPGDRPGEANRSPMSGSCADRRGGVALGDHRCRWSIAMGTARTTASTSTPTSAQYVAEIDDATRSGDAELVSVVGSDEVTGIDAEVATVFTISGRVTADGEPLAGCLVEVFDESKRYGSSMEGDGSYEVVVWPGIESARASTQDPSRHTWASSSTTPPHGPTHAALLLSATSSAFYAELTIRMTMHTISALVYRAGWRTGGCGSPRLRRHQRILVHDQHRQ